MVSAKKALEIVLNNINIAPAKTTSLNDALGHVLAKDVKAKIDVPSFDNSAMDGFALHSSDLSSKSDIDIAAEMRAGQEATVTVKRGGAVSIMTGAMVPKGTGAVIPIENASVKNKSFVIEKSVVKGANIRKRGEDIKKGTVLVKAGTLLRPIHISLSASVGVNELKVYPKPRVAVIVTGSELRQPGEPLKPGQIYNSNGFLIKGLLEKLGLEIAFFQKTQDSHKQTVAALKKALGKADIVITTGGISVGKYDFLSQALSEIGAVCHFDKIKQKPGKPLSFFTYRQKAIFSLPGNPVAAAVCFEIYARPALLKMSGFPKYFRREMKAVLAKPVKKKKGRLNWIRVNLEIKNGRYLATPTGPQGSGILTSMISDGIAVLEEEQTLLNKGQVVKVIDLEGDYR